MFSFFDSCIGFDLDRILVSITGARQTSTVKRAASNAPTTSTATYTANSFPCAFAAMSIGEGLDWFVNMALTVFVIGMITIGVFATISARNRLKRIQEQ